MPNTSIVTVALDVINVENESSCRFAVVKEIGCVPAFHCGAMFPFEPLYVTVDCIKELKYTSSRRLLITNVFPEPIK